MSKESHRKEQPAARESAKRATEPLVLVKRIGSPMPPSAGSLNRSPTILSDSSIFTVRRASANRTLRGISSAKLHEHAPRLRLLSATTSEFVANLSEAFVREGQAEFEEQHLPSISSCSRTFPPSRGALPPSGCWS